MLKDDGTPFWAQLTATAAQGAEGKRVSRIALSDITERKFTDTCRDMRQSVLQILNGPGDDLCDPEGNCRYANPAWCGMAGMSAAEVCGKGWAAGLHPENRDRVIANWNQMVESHGMWGHEYRFSTREGKVTWVCGLATPQRDPSGKIVQYVGVNMDITERKLAEAELQRLDKLQSVGTLAGGIAHEFNNILLGLFGNISMAMEDLPREHPSYAFLEEADKSMSRAFRMRPFPVSKRADTSRSLCRMKGSASTTRSATGSSIRSSLPSRPAAVWGWPRLGPSSPGTTAKSALFPS